ncbi:MAG TPA: hypothetical protein VKK79_11590 [Candidatus Lokiarchaeia archaeon]|nr:hypothetical protein [Candidatus Lokiarchaeia archaeon]
MPPLLGKEKPYKFKHSELENAENASGIMPKKKGNIPRLAVMLGLIEVKFYDIYLACSGDKTVAQLAEEMNIDISEMAMSVDKLAKNGLITL